MSFLPAESVTRETKYLAQYLVAFGVDAQVQMSVLTVLIA